VSDKTGPWNKIPLRDKIRWRVAQVLDWLPFTCWPNLVTWAQRDQRWPALAGRSCRQDAARTGTCYCGKLGEQSPRAEARRAKRRGR
jgi:hypothetical protein